MGSTIVDILARVEGALIFDRRALVQDVATCVTQATLSDQELVVALRVGALASAKLNEPSVALSADDRDRLVQALLVRAHERHPGRALVLLLAIELCCGSPDEALSVVAGEILSRNALNSAAVTLLETALRAASINIAFAPGLLDRIYRQILSGNFPLQQVLVVLQFVGMWGGAPVAAREAAFEYLALPLLRAMADRDDAASALVLENYLYSHHVKSREQPVHHKEVFAAIAEPLRRLGQSHAARLGKLPPVPVRARPRVAFLLHNGYRLAHVELLLSFFDGYVKAAEQPIEPLIYLLSKDGQDDLAKSCAKYGVEVLAATASGGMIARFEEARATLSSRGVAGVVVVSLPLYLYHLGAIKLAPATIWWPMKFPLPSFPELQGHVTYRMLFAGKRDIDGQLWRGGPLGILPPPEADPSAVVAIRAKYAGGPLLGTIAREEKIRDPGYLDAVTRIMLAHPTANFLWTGRNELPEIRDYFRKHGIGDRCHFIGWVDPAVYCQAFDLFLETFQLAGLMSGWAMANGIAVATMGSFGWLGTFLEGIHDGTISCTPEEKGRLDDVFAVVKGRVPLVWGRDGDEYVSLANQLLNDAELRRDFGIACQRFMRTFLFDTIGSSVIQAQHFADIVREQEALDRASGDGR